MALNYINTDLGSNKLIAEGWTKSSIDFDISNAIEYLSDPAKALELVRTGLAVWSEIIPTVEVFAKPRNTFFAGLSIFGSKTKENIDDTLDNFRLKRIIADLSKYKYNIKSTNIGSDETMSLLNKTMIDAITSRLGVPTSIWQVQEGKIYQYPINKFTSVANLYKCGVVEIYWEEYDIWYFNQVEDSYTSHKNLGDREIQLYSKQEFPFLHEIAQEGVGLRFNGLRHRTAINLIQMSPEFKLSQFDNNLIEFGNKIVANVDSNRPKTAAILSGQPGTGKTRFMQALIVEELVPRGFIILEVAASLITEFDIPKCYPKIVLLVNEADNINESGFDPGASKNTRIQEILDPEEFNLEVTPSDQLKQIVILMTANNIDSLQSINKPKYIDYECKATLQYTQKTQFDHILSLDDSIDYE
jgi:hypothetical protein